MSQTIEEEAWNLVHSLASECNDPDGFGSMSAAAYDTAWVAMVEKKDKNGDLLPLIPEAIDFLKQIQAEDGSWAAEVSVADGIVNTLAALLALKKRNSQVEHVCANDEKRCLAAEQSLRRMFSIWDPATSDRVGLEVLVPNLLKLLEGEGITFDFPARKTLMKANASKMARLGPALTSPVQTTLIHSLEAFVSTLDFDKVKQHRMPNGSMLASPSSTAAYLMNATHWDDKAEAYLYMVNKQQSAMGQKGGFPSAYPSMIFETSWVLDTLLEAGFNRSDFLLPDIRQLMSFLGTNLAQGNGVVGWAPSCLPDVDDTAKTISALRLLGWDKGVENMLKSFEAEHCFITYRGESNPSSTANCNVLLCLLRATEPAKYTQQIVKCARFLAEDWESSLGPDKWHISVQYRMMLIAQSFMLLLKRWANGQLDADALPQALIYQHVPRTLLEILGRTMRSQNTDGSWDSKREVTAYALLTLASLLSLPWIDFLKPEATACIYRGKAYLEANRRHWRNAEKLWVEKTVYGSPNLSQAYCLAALKTSIPTKIVSAKISDMFPMQLAKKIANMTDFFARVKPFSVVKTWELQLSLVQSVSYATALKTCRYDIFPANEKASDEKYQEYIPFTWIGCRDYLSTSLPAKTLWEMMLVSMYNFQVDAYMETVVWDQYRGNLRELKALIRALCSDNKRRKRKREDGFDQNNSQKKSANGARADNETDGTNSPVSTSHNNVSPHPVATAPQLGAFLSHDAGVQTNSRGKYEVSSHPDESPSTDRVDSPFSQLETGENSVEEVLAKFVNFALQHPRVLASPAPLRRWLAHELQTFMLAHVTHMEDCESLSVDSLKSGTWDRPRTTFFQWVHTTSADHTSCPYSFVFFLCLITGGRSGMMMNAQQRYTLEDACRHLAAMCRQYNDLGSIVRDQAEGNLNSVNFPEFSELDRAASQEDLYDRKKRDLLSIAEYERRCLEMIVHELEHSLEPDVMEKLRLFIQVTDLYGQIYVVRDIGVRHMKANGVDARH